MAVSDPMLDFITKVRCFTINPATLMGTPFLSNKRDGQNVLVSRSICRGNSCAQSFNFSPALFFQAWPSRADGELCSAHQPGQFGHGSRFT